MVSTVGLVSIAVGALFLCLRASILLAPAATLRWFKATMRTNGPIRIQGALVLTLGATMAWAGASEDSTLAFVLSLAGWVLAGVWAPAMVLFPGAIRALYNAVLPSDTGASLTLWRFGGLKGVIVSVLFIYFGARAL